MSRGAQVTVAGAGALGLCTALALARAGCRVTVFDPSAPEANASGVAAGMLAPALETVLDGEGERDLGIRLAARDLWPALEAVAGVRLDRSGAVAVGADAWLEGVRSGLNGLGLPGAELGRLTLEALTPGLSTALTRGMMTREDWRLDPRQALGALRAACSEAGVGFRRGVVTERDDADWLVAATGAGRELAPELSVLTPIKGHILRFEGQAAGRVSLRGEGVYAVACAGGLAVGATMEPGVGDASVDPSHGPPLRAAGAALIPGLAGADYEIFAGVRAATPDGLPLVGASREPGVLLAAGARRNGWLLAPLVAQVIAACVAGRDPGPYAARLDPGRR